MRTGSTLIELMVVLALVALLVAIAPASLLRATPSDDSTASAQVEAIRSGRRVQVTDSLGRAVLYLPDGRVVGDTTDAE